ncbi:hypothetical protein GGR53DRAFT_461519 [Hypoxylon sp. FL1150]|nr:hypothetical protein GGR53DRAFT_461519 [Hypoxylon sp. FL1150]
MAAPPKRAFELRWGSNYLGHTVWCYSSCDLYGRERLRREATMKSHRTATIVLRPGGIQFEHLRGSDGAGGDATPRSPSIPVHPGPRQHRGAAADEASRWRYILLSPARGLLQPAALCALGTATAPLQWLENGQYHEPVGKKTGASKMARDADLTERPWG